jgi:hypothetical protein
MLHIHRMHALLWTNNAGLLLFSLPDRHRRGDSDGSALRSVPESRLGPSPTRRRSHAAVARPRLAVPTAQHWSFRYHVPVSTY